MKTLKRILLLASLITVSSCQADTPKPPPADWKTECVGRYQVSLPGEVNLNLVNPFDLASVSSIDKSNYSSAVVNHVGIEISAKLNPPLINLNDFKHKIAIKAHALVDENTQLVKDSPEFMEIIKTNFPDYFYWESGDAIHGYYYVGSRVFSFFSNAGNSLNDNIIYLDTLIKSFHPRALYELPTQTGVCFPYGYIADEGKTPYNTAVTMRLLAHPDVEIMVSFQIADHNGQGNNPKLMHNYLHQRLEEFWGRRNYTGMYKKINISSTKSIMLDGREGAGIFANYQNYTKTDTLPVNAYGHRIYNSRDDFGLYASAEGEEGNPAKPTITVYVIRTADRAKGEPVTEAELKAMAETIIASIKPMTAK
jgi:hypothetical protein